MAFLPSRCQRCGKAGGCYIMSMFNTQMICLDCKDKEEKRDDYDKAVKEENKALKNGNRNFKGIGL